MSEKEAAMPELPEVPSKRPPYMRIVLDDEGTVIRVETLKDQQWTEIGPWEPLATAPIKGTVIGNTTLSLIITQSASPRAIYTHQYCRRVCT
jgi:hypothetical protein